MLTSTKTTKILLIHLLAGGVFLLPLGELQAVQGRFSNNYQARPEESSPRTARVQAEQQFIQQQNMRNHPPYIGRPLPRPPLGGRLAESRGGVASDPSVADGAARPRLTPEQQAALLQDEEGYMKPLEGAARTRSAIYDRPLVAPPAGARLAGSRGGELPQEIAPTPPAVSSRSAGIATAAMFKEFLAQFNGHHTLQKLLVTLRDSAYQGDAAAARWFYEIKHLLRSTFALTVAAAHQTPEVAPKARPEYKRLVEYLLEAHAAYTRAKTSQHDAFMQSQLLEKHIASLHRTYWKEAYEVLYPSDQPGAEQAKERVQSYFEALTPGSGQERSKPSPEAARFIEAWRKGVSPESLPPAELTLMHQLLQNPLYQDSYGLLTLFLTQAAPQLPDQSPESQWLTSQLTELRARPNWEQFRPQVEEILHSHAAILPGLLGLSEVSPSAQPVQSAKIRQCAEALAALTGGPAVADTLATLESGSGADSEASGSSHYAEILQHNGAAEQENEDFSSTEEARRKSEFERQAEEHRGEASAFGSVEPHPFSETRGRER